jgi:hypothetical protein
LRQKHGLRVLEKRKIFRSKRGELTELGRRLHNEELRDLRPLPYIISFIKSRRRRWMEVLMGKSEGKILLEDLIVKT